MTPISLSTDCRVAIAEDAESLAALHDRELTPKFFSALRETRFPECLGLMPATVPTTSAWRA
ncbi:MAG: putative dimethyl sulfoxide reductase chaperone, partial [Pseudomonadota bacterium]|nr:putative dimethyl sulfoxide reductase chaperone [Pseudomonadota bacterium]